MDSRDSDDHMQTEGSTPHPAEVEMQDLEQDSAFHLLPESPTSTPLSLSSYPSSTALASESSERIGLRRTRVEDDHDDERDRRHPSQRVGSPSHPSTSLRSSSSTSALHATAAASASTPTDPASFSSRISGASNAGSPTTSSPFRFFQHMLPFTQSHNNTASSPSASSSHVTPAPPQHNTTASTSTTGGAPASSSSGTPSSGANADAAAATRPPRLNIVHQYLGGFAISFDVNGVRTAVPLSGTTPPTPNAPRPTTDANTMAAEPPTDDPSGENPASEQPQPQPQQQPQQQQQQQAQPPPPQQQRRFPGEGGQGLPTNNAIADLLRHLSILTALSMGGAGVFDRDMEDPERAKKLVDGLEDVPVGLVKRLERVGKTFVDDEENAEAEGTGLGDGGCAICWDRLLTKDKPDDAPPTGDETNPSTEPSTVPSDSPPIPPTEEAEETALDNDDTAPGDYKRVVSLPCAHVFHAKCLIPWFSKPKQTTCPICRFNIDPENLTYTSGAQRRAAARREREQERARARAEGGANNEERDEGEGGNDGDGQGIGIDIPLFGGTPIVVPLGGGRRGEQQPADAPPVGAQDQPAADGADADAPAEDDAPHTGDHGHDHRLQDIVTIGVDMYIGRGPPPPFAMRGGANVFQFPFPGGADGPFMNAATPGNPPSATNANADNNADAEGANPPQSPTAGEGNARTNERGNGGQGRGTTFAIPLGQGFGRIVGETFSRIFTAGHGHEHGNRDQHPPPATTTAPATAGAGTGPAAQPQVFGPERPPAPMRGSMPVPGGVGIGVGGGAPGGDNAPQNGGGGQQGAGGGAGAPRMFETMIPLLDILFGPRTPTQPQPQGEAQTPPAEPAPQQPEGGPAAPHPAQPQPQHPQERSNPPTTGFGWTFVSGPAGSPPTFISSGGPPPLHRPASAPVPGHRQRTEPRKLWAPPPAPGLTLRQRVEKREQEAGLRCCDVSCGVGPSDEDPWVDIGLEGLKQLSIRKFEEIGEEEEHHHCDAVCDHTFHSSCLVSAERVASRGASPAFVGPEGREEVEVSCPVCRGMGRVSKDDWEIGVRALLA